MPGDGLECESFTVISTDSLFVHEDKYYLQEYLDKWVYKTVHAQMLDYLENNLFEADED